jgi:hypothetical protein
MIVKLILMILVSVLLAGCGSKVDDPEEIYKVVFAQVEYPGKRIHLRSRAVYPDSKMVRQEDLAYFSSFRFLNPSEKHSAADFAFLQALFISEEEESAIFNDGCEQNWQTFHKKYPGAVTLFGVSHIGFSEDGRLAIVYLEGVSGCRDSRGVLFSLERIEGNWKVIDYVTLWQS